MADIQIPIWSVVLSVEFKHTVNTVVMLGFVKVTFCNRKEIALKNFFK